MHVIVLATGKNTSLLGMLDQEMEIYLCGKLFMKGPHPPVGIGCGNFTEEVDCSQLHLHRGLGKWHRR